jgi:diguanylate cyclase (GGDEF)-like protein
LLAALVLFFAPATATSPWQNLADPIFVRADTRALPEAAVMALAQDSAGFLWIGTQGGLARYDGYRTRSFLPDASDPAALPDGYVRTLLPAADGGLWIGSSSNGLVHFDAATETFRTWRPDPAGRDGPRSAAVDALFEAGGGRLWVGGDGGLGLFDPAAQRFAPVALATHGPQPVVWSLLVDREGTVWAGTQDGLYYRSPHAATFRAFPLTAAARLPGPTIYSLFEDRAGRVWAGSVNAVFVVDAGRHGARALASSDVDPDSVAPGQQWSLIEMTPGVMWAGTDAAISIVDEQTFAVRRVAADPKNPGGLSAGRVLQFLRDGSGLVWLANHVGGLEAYNPASSGLYELSNTRPEIGFGEQGAPALLAQGTDRLWAGGFDGRLAEFHAPSAASTELPLSNHAAVQTLAAGSDGTLWVGSTGGLCRLDPGGGRVRCPHSPSEFAGPSVYAILEEGGRLWVGGSTGLLVEDLASTRVTAFPPPGSAQRLSNSQVRALYLDRRRRLWVGTENGLDRIDPGGRIVHFTYSPGNPNSLGPGGMTALLEDRRGRIWAGAVGGPLDVLQDQPDGTTRIRHITVADGLPHENVDGLAEDATGRIWVSTDQGIAQIDPDTLHARAFGQADGVSEGAYWAGAMTRATDGSIFFGGLEGISVVAPGASSDWTYAPPVVVSALRLGRHDVPVWRVNHGDPAVSLADDARDIQVEFSALDYSAPQSLRYEYKLDGYDRDWIDTDAQHRVASYTHLAPGDYTLEVRGTNRLGVWSRHVFRLSVRALPAWNETWWFRALVAALLVLAAYAAHTIRTTVLRRRQRELEATVEARTRELVDANAKLQELSLSDPLTGLRNRRFLTQHLEADIAMTLRRYEDWLAAPGAGTPEDADMLFFLVDLDHFKIVNDRYGHHAGDLMLMEMRERLQEVFRESDFVVRWGGDEFLTVVRAGRRNEAGLIAERIREAVARRPFAVGGDQTMAASVSVGFAAFPFVPSAPDAVTWLQVVGLADHALYMAKQAGRNTWFGVAATGQTNPATLVRLENGIEDLLRSGALEVVTRVPRRRSAPVAPAE